MEKGNLCGVQVAPDTRRVTRVKGSRKCATDGGTLDNQSINQRQWWIVHLLALPGRRPLQKAVKYKCKSEIRIIDGHRRLLGLQLFSS